MDTQLQLDEASRYGTPNLEPLHFALESSARVLLAVIDDEWRRLLSVHLGGITKLYRLENILGTADIFRIHVLPEPDAHPLQSVAEEALRNASVRHL
ncbi:hypothetical protein GCM10022631_09680 [Deinococcus rubellus]|uniref:hypothetical protein n=1 Tax=Deinococcus rubellus TaxID=1889240 RepID=UPI0031EBE6FB